MSGAAYQQDEQIAEAAPASLAGVRRIAVRMPECADERGRLLARYAFIRAEIARQGPARLVPAGECGGQG